MLKTGFLPYYDEKKNFQFNTSKETLKWLGNHKIKGELNPPKSPDLSPIENVWSWIAHKVYHEKSAYENVEFLRNTIFKFI